MNENKNFADQPARAARETLEKGTAAAEEFGKRRAAKLFHAVAEGIRDFNVRLMGNRPQLNTVAALDFARRDVNSEGARRGGRALRQSHY